jgi:hypothetical protein
MECDDIVLICGADPQAGTAWCAGCYWSRQWDDARGSEGQIQDRHYCIIPAPSGVTWSVCVEEDGVRIEIGKGAAQDQDEAHRLIANASVSYEKQRSAGLLERSSSQTAANRSP